MLRKIFAALIVGSAVAYYVHTDEVEITARDMLDAAGREARETVVERCLADPAECVGERVR